MINFEQRFLDQLDARCNRIEEKIDITSVEVVGIREDLARLKVIVPVISAGVGSAATGVATFFAHRFGLL